MSKRLDTIWNADPHTLAKIAILKNYLHAWFRILGKTATGQTLLYVDGFSGPGYYRNHPEGSPLAALNTAVDAVKSFYGGMPAKSIHCAFIEKDKARYEAMSAAVAPFEKEARIGVTKIQDEFVNGIEAVKRAVPAPFRGEGPLFVFADPFGGTGIPFVTFVECMKSGMAELLINLDADGIARIFQAESNNRREEQLTELFGGAYWKDRLAVGADQKTLSVQILDLYKERLRTLPGVKFIWSFAMRGKTDAINYYLVFASKHKLGLEKMKEAMRLIDKSGAYSFSDAHVDQHVLFRADDEELFAQKLFEKFNGQTLLIDDVNLYALNETPFLNAKAMLAVLENGQFLQIECHPGQTRRAGTFPEEKIRSIRFGKFAKEMLLNLEF